MCTEELIAKAIEAKKNSYAPYSNFHVGAAVLTKSGKAYTGCNIENVSFGATNCAERTAIFKAVSEGETEFESIAIVGENGDYLPPCGVCLQVMAEFGSYTMKIIMANSTNDYKLINLGELLPKAFSAEHYFHKR